MARRRRVIGAKRAPRIDPASRVAAHFRAYPRGVARKLLELRRLILDVASSTEGVGELEETLKWGQPSYVTAGSGSGSTIRIDRVRSRPGRYAMYFHCRTTLVDTFRRLYPRALRYDGNRGIALALTYHLAKRRRA